MSKEQSTDSNQQSTPAGRDLESRPHVSANSMPEETERAGNLPPSLASDVASNSQQTTGNEMPKTIQNLVISLDNAATEKTIHKLAELLKTLPKGESKIYLRLRGATIETSFAIEPTPESVEILKSNFPNVEANRERL